MRLEKYKSKYIVIDDNNKILIITSYKRIALNMMKNA